MADDNYMDKDELTEEEYYKPFNEFVKKQTTPDGSLTTVEYKKVAALERAWKNRDFEIDKYWSRATYFWAFIAATFAGYIAIYAAQAMDAALKKHLGFMVNCMGIIFSLAWVLVNFGSKKWQENWEKHIDMLEDDITGPLYKTVINKTSHSVSRINISVSFFVLAIWLILAAVEIHSEWILPKGTPDYIIISTLVVTLAATLLMLLSNISSSGKEFDFNRRRKKYKRPAPPPPPPPPPPEQKPKNVKHS